MDELSGLVPYRIAKQQLEARLKTTDDEIAMWVSGIDEGGLNAYVMDSFRKTSLFTFEPRHFINDDNYINPLEGVYFLPEDIERFQPAKRYISRKALIQRWARLCGDEASAINFVKYRAKDSALFEYHPIAGCVESTGDLARNGLFDLNHVQQIEFKFFPESPDKAIEANAVVATDNTHPMEPANIKVTQANKNDMRYSGLLNIPKKADDWFQVIDDMTKDFYNQHEKMPNETQAWARLWTSPPDGYEITTSTEKSKEDCLKMPGVSNLSKSAFSKRWDKYTANKPQ